ncbi:3839_t:CDS:10 [Racocetra persica]|uniref:3839_t:CDS:1 n=1 Tax=Racocetra persica TaxID=160502 RepID=A0ACA9LGG1_9GLOM|nr:3839_t:CDS:10 [Racocetra persica]
MGRYTPSPAVFNTDSEIDEYVSQTIGTDVSPNRIQYSWLSIANLYFKVGNYSKTEKYLLELLKLQSEDYEANDLLGTVYRRQGRQEAALDFYERALCSKGASQNRALDAHNKFVLCKHKAAELCTLLAKKAKDETEIKKFTDKSLFWIERTRQVNKKYIPRAVQLLHKTYIIIVQHAERQSDRRGCLKRRDGSTPVASIQWIDDTIKSLLTVEDTFIDPAFHIILAKALLKMHDHQRVWKHVLQRRYNFVDSLEWNLFVKNTFPKLRKLATIDSIKELLHESTELIFFACDNVVRLSLKIKPRDESGKLVKEFSDLIKTWETPSSQNHQVVEKWTRYRQEYQYRSLRHDGYFQFKLASSDLSQFKLLSKTVQKNQEHLCAAYSKFKACLSFRRETFRDPNRPITHFIYLMCQRISDVSHQLLVLLHCFDYAWLNKSDSAAYVLKPRSQYEDDVRQNFVLPGHVRLIKELIQNVGKNQLAELSTLKWLAQMSNQIDKIAFCAPYDLDRFLAVSAWYMESGVLREWLRYIFPRLEDCPKFPEPGKRHDIPSSIQTLSSLFESMSIRNQMGTGLARLLSKQERKTKRNLIIETPTLIDIEFFLIILLIQRQYHCVVDQGAESLGQILYLASQECWKPRESQRKFWRTLLWWYGKNDPDKRIYTSDLMSNEEFSQCIREIRGDINLHDYDYNQTLSVINLQRDLFLVIAILFEAMITRYNQCRSTEGLHCVEVHQNWEMNVSKGESTNDTRVKFAILDDEVKEPGYRMFIPVNSDLEKNDMTERLSFIFTENGDMSILELEPGSTGSKSPTQPQSFDAVNSFIIVDDHDQPFGELNHSMIETTNVPESDSELLDNESNESNSDLLINFD